MNRPLFNSSDSCLGLWRIFPGSTVKVSGQLKSFGFTIKLHTGPASGKQQDPQPWQNPSAFRQPQVVKNPLDNCDWTFEVAWKVRTESIGLRLFELIILAQQDKLKVVIDGKEYCELAHQIPCQEVTYLTIYGDVKLHGVQFESDGTGIESKPGLAPADDRDAKASESLSETPGGPVSAPRPEDRPKMTGIWTERNFGAPIEEGKESKREKFPLGR